MTSGAMGSWWGRLGDVGCAGAGWEWDSLWSPGEGGGGGDCAWVGRGLVWVGYALETKRWWCVGDYMCVNVDVTLMCGIIYPQK